MNSDEAAALANARVGSLLAAAERNGGANERRLTDTMATLLAEDHAAAGCVASLLTSRLLTVAQLKVAPNPIEVDCATERPFGRASRSGPRERRTDLVFSRGDWALVVEVKLGAPLSGVQVADLLALDPRDLGLSEHTRVGVLGLTTHAIAVKPPEDPGLRWLGVVRWSAVIDEALSVPFANPDLGESWTRLMSLYMRRSKFGPTALHVLHPHTVLQLVAPALRDHVETKVGQRVEFAPNAAGRIVRRTPRAASLELVFGAGPRRLRTLKIMLSVPRGGNRTLRLELAPGRSWCETRRVPARIEKFEPVLLDHVDALLS